MNIDVFISHHTRTCLKVTEAICNKLESNGIKVWYAPRDTKYAYASDIVNVINECKVFILVLNKETSESYDCLNEINCVAERIRHKEEVHVLPFLISNDEIGGDTKYYFGRFHWIDAITPPLDARIDELVSRVKKVLEGNYEEEYVDIYEEKLYSTNIFNNLNFIGRDKELKKIEEQLLENSKVFINGIGGIGKSEIVKKYIYIHKNEYKNIIFAKYETNLEQLIISDNNFKISNFNRIINQDGILENDQEYFERKLNKIKELANDNKTLIVIDNFDTTEDINLEKILDGNYDLIITTRNDFSDIGYPVIKIEAMDNIEDLIKLFKKNYMRVQDEENIIKIINYLDGHTLAIELVSKYMQRARINESTMLKILEEKGINPELKGNISYNLKNNNIYDYIKTLFDISKITDEEKDVLCNLSMFSINEVSFDIFISLCGYQDGFVIDDLIRKSWINYDIENDKIALHPLIVDVIKNECCVNLDTCSTLFNNITKLDSWKMTFNERIQYEKLILNIYNNYLILNKNNLNQFTTISLFLRDLGYYDQAEDLLLKILDKQIEIYGEESREVAITYDNLRFVCNKCYKVDKANYYNDKAIEILKNNHLDDYLLADYMKSRAFSYLKDRVPLKAKELLIKVMEIFKSILPDDHYKIGNTNIAFARLYNQLKDYNNARMCAEEAIRILSLKYDRISVDIATSLMELGIANVNLGNIKQGIDELEETLNIREKLFHKDDFSILDAKEYLADGYILNKENDKAKKLLLEIKDVFDKKNIDNNKDMWYIRIQNKINNLR